MRVLQVSGISFPVTPQQVGVVPLDTGDTGLSSSISGIMPTIIEFMLVMMIMKMMIGMMSGMATGISGSSAKTTSGGISY
jgi:ATP-dependent Zn protease